jgi:hypothetical protein
VLASYLIGPPNGVSTHTSTSDKQEILADHDYKPDVVSTVLVATIFCVGCAVQSSLQRCPHTIVTSSDRNDIIWEQQLLPQLLKQKQQQHPSSSP